MTAATDKKHAIARISGPNTDKGTAPMLGGASIIMVFAVLCLTVFAVLTLLTADSERKLSGEYKDSVDAYYRADAEAVAFVSELRTEAKNGSWEAAAKKLGADFAEITDGGKITKDFPLDDAQFLHVMLTVRGENAQVSAWTLVNGRDMAD